MIDYIDSMFRLIDKWNSTIVTCTNCGHQQDLTEYDYAEHYVTVWGNEDGPKEYQCGECDHTMMVQERVMRWFDVIENDSED